MTSVHLIVECEPESETDQQIVLVCNNNNNNKDLMPTVVVKDAYRVAEIFLEERM